MMRGLSGPSMAQLRHRTRAPMSATGGGELVNGSRCSSSGKRCGKAEAKEELRVEKIKPALASHRCSQQIRVNGDRGGARGSGAAWAARGAQRGWWHEAVQQERPLGGGAVTTNALSKRAPDDVDLSGSAL
jgi:hypothetical protein